jgi:hypothetical protein
MRIIDWYKPCAYNEPQKHLFHREARKRLKALAEAQATMVRVQSNGILAYVQASAHSRGFFARLCDLRENENSIHQMWRTFMALKIKQIFWTVISVLLVGLIGVFLYPSLRLVTAQKPPPFSFWYFESLPEIEKESAAEKYLLGQHPIGSNIIDAVHEVERSVIDSCSKSGASNYVCTYTWSTWRNFSLSERQKWVIEFFDKNNNGSISGITATRWNPFVSGHIRPTNLN